MTSVHKESRSDLVLIDGDVVDDQDVARLQPHDSSPAFAPTLGAWYWVTGNKDFRGKPEPDWLGCAMKVGSNFILIESPPDRNGSFTIRIHFDEFTSRLRYEPDADHVIRQRIGHWQQESQRLMGAIEEVTQSLGMTPDLKIGAPAAAGQAAGALMVLSTQVDPKAYGRALVRAKEKTLPALFEELKKAHGTLAMWMKAPVMPTMAQMRDQRELVEEIDDRIFSVGLYAGLTEEAVLISDGAPAAASEKLHVQQRMLFCDEECLANYRHGGMDITGLESFGEWLAQPENLDRILPNPRCLVAMRIRRAEKNRDWAGSLKQLHINFELGELDKLTFLFVRNGAQLWRLSTDIDFGELIFPDPTTFNPNEPKVFSVFAGSVKRFMSTSEYESRVAAEKARREKYRAWDQEHPKESGNPYWRGDSEVDQSWDRWHPFDSSSVYFDEASAALTKEIKAYNRVALIIQGLFDRSMVLHPHPKAKTWTADGFDAAVKLVYDGTGVLHYGEAPDFEAYRAKCNATLGPGSMTVGQVDAWELREGRRESARLDRDWRNRSEYRPERFRPYGNPGPAYVARVERWSKRQGATFTWQRKRLSNDGYQDKHVGDTITVPASALFNVDAYRLGDFRQFFADPRTRARYLTWAPMLMAAEEYHAKLAAKGEGA